jgi:hypothetical protein
VPAGSVTGTGCVNWTWSNATSENCLYINVHQPATHDDAAPAAAAAAVRRRGARRPDARHDAQRRCTGRPRAKQHPDLARNPVRRAAYRPAPLAQPQAGRAVERHAAGQGVQAQLRTARPRLGQLARSRAGLPQLHEGVRELDLVKRNQRRLPVHQRAPVSNPGAQAAAGGGLLCGWRLRVGSRERRGEQRRQPRRQARLGGRHPRHAQL